MIVVEHLPDNLVRTYSDRGMMLRQIPSGIEYAEAVDPVDSNRKYQETKTPVSPKGE